MACVGLRLLGSAQLQPREESPTDSSRHLFADENCVGLLEWFDEDGKVFLIMELLTGAPSVLSLHHRGNW